MARAGGSGSFGSSGCSAGTTAVTRGPAHTDFEASGCTLAVGGRAHMNKRKVAACGSIGWGNV